MSSPGTRVCVHGGAGERVGVFGSYRSCHGGNSWRYLGLVCFISRTSRSGTTYSMSGPHVFRPASRSLSRASVGADRRSLSPSTSWRNTSTYRYRRASSSPSETSSTSTRPRPHPPNPHRLLLHRRSVGERWDRPESLSPPYPPWTPERVLRFEVCPTVAPPKEVEGELVKSRVSSGRRVESLMVRGSGLTPSLPGGSEESTGDRVRRQGSSLFPPCPRF